MKEGSFEGRGGRRAPILGHALMLGFLLLGGSELARADAPEPGPEAAGASLRGSLHLGLLHRSLQARALASASSRREPGGLFEETRGYQSRDLGHPELGLSLELNPARLLGLDSLGWLTLRALYSRALALESRGPGCTLGPSCGGESSVAIDSSQSELRLDLRARLPLIRGPRSGDFLLELGWGYFDFSLSLEDLVRVARRAIVPPLEYRYLSVGAGISQTLWPGLLRLEAIFAYRHVHALGEDALRIWGTRTERSRGWILRLALESEAAFLREGLTLHLGVEIFHFVSLFRGQTSCALGGGDAGPCAPSDPWEPWPEVDGLVVGGLRDPVRDAYARIQLGLGFAFR
ncbi:MAG: hypothetical protein OEY14_04635 [Myxococcales bacterium]|nr:hypothetical protein [Myxococcales bacterium]